MITGLPDRANGNNAVVVFVDRMTKMIHVAPCTKEGTGEELSELSMKHVYVHHGMPQDIVSDRDPRIMSDFWQHWFKRFRTKLRPTSSYHPESDGRIECTNRTLEDYQRGYINASQDE